MSNIKVSQDDIKKLIVMTGLVPVLSFGLGILSTIAVLAIDKSSNTIDRPNLLSSVDSSGLSRARQANTNNAVAKADLVALQPATSIDHHATTQNHPSVTVEHDFQSESARSLAATEVSIPTSETSVNLNSKTNALHHTHNYHLQAGVFADKHNALSFMRSLRKKGLPAILYTKTNGNNEAIYRVMLGPYEDEMTARRYQSLIETDYSITLYLKDGLSSRDFYGVASL